MASVSRGSALLGRAGGAQGTAGFGSQHRSLLGSTAESQQELVRSHLQCRANTPFVKFGVEDQGQGLEAHRVHEEFTVWCKAQSNDLAFDMETGSKDKVVMEASLVQLGGKRDFPNQDQ